MQVLVVMKNIIKPQSLMMTHNREVHRLLPAGPALQPAAFSTVQQALLYRRPLPTAAQPSQPSIILACKISLAAVLKGVTVFFFVPSTQNAPI